ncbi:hypothetical protein PENANT_c003G06093 [Penicillium antarcticum]|uniref:Phosphatidylglycerol lysyltransferase C-terminal domain-containing protein n=1 Tax=Penicillium antarcticum TaxID=416450 RepID=A0A1V6QHW3_9EURO|nr:uncharacterized protein N7508_005732 [Penicillium antarcticum]KAJ5306717.1 hypothetical protein N7508_005732 [Penicillium antarcticum]OQD88793.1 hypothetical protein PENANT_c003G06093 [Penicillium antarcticum]
MASAVDSRESISISTGKKRRPRRGRKATLDIDGPNPRKSLLLDEIGDDLVDQLYASPRRNGHLDDSCATSFISVADHLRNNLAAALAASSCASSASRSTRTMIGSISTPATSVDINEPPQVTHSLEPPVDLPDPKPKAPRPKKGLPEQADVFSLDDFTIMTAIEQLAAYHGRVAHMGILDRSYRFFVNKSRTAAISFKVQNGVAVVGGDPLCDTAAIPELLSEFAEYRKRHHWGIAFMGASETFTKGYAQREGWTTIRFGTERVLDPQVNEVLLETSGKRITTQNRQLLSKAKGNITLGVYAPAVHGTVPQLQADLVAIYDAWREERNSSSNPQAFITVYDPFALPALMTFVYTCGADRHVNGFAALRHLGSGGYHVDPCIAAPGSAKGISDLLLVAAMALLNRAGVSYLGFGFEPLHALTRDDVSGIPGPFAHLTRDLYGHAFHRLPIGGKRAYHDKFRPDPMQDSGLYLVFPSGVPGPRHLLAMTHMANISWRKIFWADVRGWASRAERSAAVEGAQDQQRQPKDQDQARIHNDATKKSMFLDRPIPLVQGIA